MTDLTRCPRCNNVVHARYREVPKGQEAQFWCIDCLASEMKPDAEVIKIVNTINPPNGEKEK